MGELRLRFGEGMAQCHLVALLRGSADHRGDALHVGERLLLGQGRSCLQRRAAAGQVDHREGEGRGGGDGQAGGELPVRARHQPGHHGHGHHGAPGHGGNLFLGEEGEQRVGRLHAAPAGGTQGEVSGGLLGPRHLRAAQQQAQGGLVEVTHRVGLRLAAPQADDADHAPSSNPTSARRSWARAAMARDIAVRSGMPSSWAASS